MKLTSPRENPYSELNKLKEEYKNEGYAAPLTIISETVATIGEKEIKAKEMHIAMQHRFISDKNESDNKALYAISAKDGSKGYLEASYGKFANETTDAFLRNVDTSDNIDNISQ